jgi:hypothetical protein
MQTEEKSPLLIFGTPLGNWQPLADSILKASRLPTWDHYQDWHRDLFGAASTEFEVGLSRLESQKLKVPELLPDKIERLASNGHSSAGSVGVSVYGCWTSDYWVKMLPSATCLVFFEHPSWMLSRQLASAPSVSAESLLSIWCASTRKVLADYRRHRNRFYLLNAQECLRFEKQYKQWAQAHLGISPSVDDGLGEPFAGDAILHALAERFCSENSMASDLFLELEASAQPVSDGWNSSSAGKIDHPPATPLTELLVLRRKSSELAASDREKESKLAGLQANLASSQRELEEARKLLAETSRKLELVEVAKVVALRGASELARRKEEETAGKCEMLLKELHEAFLESEGYFERWKKAESSGKELALKVGTVIRGDSSEQTEHRHVNYTFQNVVLLGRHWSSVRLRLVQHFGHAGVAIFASNAGGSPPLHGWRPSGTENGSPLMLFVPTDAPARDALVRATTSDLFFIRDAVFLVYSDLRMVGLPKNSRTPWFLVAERLLQEMDELPERLHYDSVRVALRRSTNSELPFLFDVQNASFRGCVFSSLKFSWGPSLPGGRLILTLTDSARAPLTYWPQTDDGKLADALDIQPSWNKFTGRDRAFLRTILLEIPNFLVHAAQQHPTEADGLKRLQVRMRMSSVLPRWWQR